MEDIKKLVNLFPVICATADSLFVFKGKYRVVLFNYPTISKRIEFVFLQLSKFMREIRNE